MRYCKDNVPYSTVVYHAEEMRVMLNVVWVDDDTHRYGAYVYNGSGSYVVEGGVIVIKEHQAKKIGVHLDVPIIIINPIADDAPEEAMHGNEETTEA